MKKVFDTSLQVLIFFVLIFCGLNCSNSFNDDLHDALTIKVNYDTKLINGSVFIRDAETGLPITAPVTISFIKNIEDSTKYVSYIGEKLDSANFTDGIFRFSINKQYGADKNQPLECLIYLSSPGYKKKTTVLTFIGAGHHSFHEALEKEGEGDNIFEGLVVSGISVEKFQLGMTNSTGGLDSLVKLIITVNQISDSLTVSNTLTCEITLYANTHFFNSNGEILFGDIRAQVAFFDASNPKALEHFPGGLASVNSLINGVQDSGSFNTAGLIAINMTVGNKQVKTFSQNISISMETISSLINPQKGTPISIGDTVPVWTYDSANAIWLFEKNCIFSESVNNNNLKTSFLTNHLSYYNLAWLAQDNAIITLFLRDAPSELKNVFVSPGIVTIDEFNQSHEMPLPVLPMIYDTKNSRWMIKYAGLPLDDSRILFFQVRLSTSVGGIPFFSKLYTVEFNLRETFKKSIYIDYENEDIKNGHITFTPTPTNTNMTVPPPILAGESWGVELSLPAAPLNKYRYMIQDNNSLYPVTAPVILDTSTIDTYLLSLNSFRSYYERKNANGTIYDRHFGVLNTTMEPIKFTIPTGQTEGFHEQPLYVKWPLFYQTNVMVTNVRNGITVYLHVTSSDQTREERQIKEYILEGTAISDTIHFTLNSEVPGTNLSITASYFKSNAVPGFTNVNHTVATTGNNLHLKATAEELTNARIALHYPVEQIELKGLPVKLKIYAISENNIIQTYYYGYVASEYFNELLDTITLPTLLPSGNLLRFEISISSFINGNEIKIGMNNNVILEFNNNWSNIVTIPLDFSLAGWDPAKPPVFVTLPFQLIIDCDNNFEIAPTLIFDYRIMPNGEWQTAKMEDGWTEIRLIKDLTYEFGFTSPSNGTHHTASKLIDDEAIASGVDFYESEEFVELSETFQEFCMESE